MSRKSIVLLITRTRATGLDVGEGILSIGIHDYFFVSDVFTPNDAKQFHESGPPDLAGFSAPREAGSQAEAVAEVVFVQFVDGSIWGDPTDGKEALRQRHLAWQKLKSLAETLRSSGEQEFVRELLRLHEPGFLGDAYIDQLRNDYRDNHGDVQPAIAELKKMLRAADSHAHSLPALMQN